MVLLRGAALLEKYDTVEFIGTGPDGLSPTPGEAMCSGYTAWEREDNAIGPHPRSFMRFLASEGLLVDQRVQQYTDLQLKDITLRQKFLWMDKKLGYDISPGSVARGNIRMQLDLLVSAMLDAWPPSPRAARQERRWAAREA